MECNGFSKKFEDMDGWNKTSDGRNAFVKKNTLPR